MYAVRIRTLSYLILLLASLVGCSVRQGADARTSQSASASVESAGKLSPAGPNLTQSEIDAPALSANSTEASGLQSNFDLGPGDIVVLTAPDVPELNNYRARVSTDNVLELPIVGDIDVTGRNERELRNEIKQRLARFVQDPQLDLFVQHYESREVAVLGMVQKPGVYTLNKSTSTVLDAIGRAGGMTSDAAARVILVHSEAAESALEGPKPRQDLSASDGDRGVTGPFVGEPNSAEGGGPAEYIHTNSDTTEPTVIDLGVPTDQNKLSVRVSPGDTVIVPTAGLVMVKGWVQSPGAYKIVPGMTVLGAVAAAGGEMFSSSVTLLRTGEYGTKETKSLNLTKIANDQEPDVKVLSGDVVVVDRSAVGFVPYVVYSLFTRLGTGVYANPF
jgi:protein involved in polysaccharide export with SLBB domain